MRTIKTVFKLLTVAVLFICASLIIFLMTRPPDIAPFDDTYLQPDIGKISEGQNAYYVYKKAINQLSYPDVPIGFFSILDWGNSKSWDLKATRTYLQENKDALDQIIIGNNIPDYQRPVPDFTQSSLEEASNWVSSIVSEAIRYRVVSKLFLIQALVYINDGDTEKAKDSIVNCLKFTDSISRNPTLLIDHLLIRGIRGVSVANTVSLVSGDDFSSEQLIEIQTELQKVADAPREFDTVLRYEYAYSTMLLSTPLIMPSSLSSLIDTVIFDSETQKPLAGFTSSRVALMLAKHSWKYMLRPNKTKQKMAACISTITNNTSTNFKEVMLSQFNECKPVPFNTMRERWDFLSDNAVGKVIFSMIFPKVSRSFKISFKSTESYLAVIALYRYRNDHGSFPDSLEKLTPEYLAEVPLDIDGNPLRYSKEKQILYTIGDDMIDSKGNSTDDVVTFLDGRRFPRINKTLLQ